MMHRNYRCLDGFCGALDCPRCHPENFDREGNYLDPDYEEQTEEETTMKTKAQQFTPGPWRKRQFDRSFGVNNDQRIICTTANALSLERLAEDEANARLISAAPDLLEALQYIDTAAPEIDESDNDEDLIEIVISVRGLRDLKAAIAKATDE